MDDPYLWLPNNYSTTGGDIDFVWNLIFVITMVVGIAVEGLIVYFCLKYRRREGQKAHYSHGSHKVEITASIGTVLTLVVIFLFSVNTWAAMKNELPEDIGLEVQVTGRQFVWYFDYPGADGELGTNDDIRAPERMLCIPANTNVVARIGSIDVIHSFFLPHMRVKQDAVPGLTTTAWFNVTEPSDPGPDGQYQTIDDVPYPIVCAELCGYNHHTMWGKLYVMPPEQWRQWMQELIQAQ
jgi:cytochrome c oxidase subunit 2